MADPAPRPSDVPVLRVVRGQPNAAELAALVTVLTALARRAAQGDRPAAARPGGSPWATYWRHTDRTPRPGPGAWRASGLPR